MEESIYLLNNELADQIILGLAILVDQIAEIAKLLI